jgi:hypothetical protein
MLLPGIAQGLPSIDNGELFVAATNFNSVQAGDLLFAGSRDNASSTSGCPPAPNLFGAGWLVIASRSQCSIKQPGSTDFVTAIAAIAVHQYVSGSVPSVSGTVGFRVVLRNTKNKTITRAAAGDTSVDISTRKQPRCIIQVTNGGGSFSAGGFGGFEWQSAPALGQVDSRSRDAEYSGGSNRIGIWFPPYVDPTNVPITTPSGGANNVVFLA